MTRHWCGPECGYCQNRAEERAADTEPDYDVEAAENSYERAMWGDL